MELDFKEIEFQNVIIGLSNVTIGLKNATIGLLEPSIGQSHLGKKKFVGKRRYRA